MASDDRLFRRRAYTNLPIWRLFVALHDAEQTYGQEPDLIADLAAALHQKLNIKTRISALDISPPGVQDSV